MDLLHEGIRIPVAGNLPEQGQGCGGISTLHRADSGQIPGIQPLFRAVLVIAQVPEGFAGRFPVACLQQLSGADVGDLRQAGRGFIGIAQRSVKGLCLIIAAFREHDLRLQPVTFRQIAAGGDVGAGGQQGILRLGDIGAAKALQDFPCPDDFRLGLGGIGGIQESFRLVITAQVGIILGIAVVVKAGKEGFCPVVLARLIGLHAQLIFDKGKPVLHPGKGGDGDNGQNGGSFSDPAVAAFAAHEVLFIGKFPAGLAQGFPAMLGQRVLPRGDHRIDGLPAVLAEDLFLLPVAAGAQEGIIQVGTTAHTDPQALLLIGIAAGHIARDGTQGGQLCRTVQVVWLVGDHILLLPAPHRGIVEPYLIHRDFIPVSADVALHGHDHLEGSARDAVEAPAAVDQLGGFLPVLGGQEERHLHTHHLQGGEVEQRHLTIRLILPGKGDFPCLDGAGQVNAHHLGRLLSSGAIGIGISPYRAGFPSAP